VKRYCITDSLDVAAHAALDGVEMIQIRAKELSGRRLTELVRGRKVSEVATLPREELLEEIGIPLTPIRLKCAILGLGVLKVALHKAKGTPLPEEWQGMGDDLSFS